jgi:hypothetical protein
VSKGKCVVLVEVEKLKVNEADKERKMQVVCGYRYKTKGCKVRGIYRGMWSEKRGVKKKSLKKMLKKSGLKQTFYNDEKKKNPPFTLLSIDFAMATQVKSIETTKQNKKIIAKKHA